MSLRLALLGLGGLAIWLGASKVSASTGRQSRRILVIAESSVFHVAYLPDGARVRWFYAGRPAIDQHYTTQGLVSTTVVPGTVLSPEALEQQTTRMTRAVSSAPAWFGLPEGVS